MGKRGTEEEGGISLTLFPHCHAAPETLHALLARFGRIRIGIPWHMEAPEGARERAGLEILRPPDTLRPPEDFTVMLREYVSWMQAHEGRGGVSFVQAARDLLGAEETSWEISKAIRTMRDAEKTQDPAKRALQWHLMLHLATEMERGQADAERIIQELRQRSSPLKEALDDEGEPAGILDDLPASEGITDDRRLSKTLAAWVGLFGGSAGPDTLLLTLDRQVMAHVEDLLDEYGEPGTWKAFETSLPDLAPGDSPASAAQHLGSLLGPEGRAYGVAEKEPARGLKLRVIRLPGPEEKHPAQIREQVPSALALLHFPDPLAAA